MIRKVDFEDEFALCTGLCSGIRSHLRGQKYHDVILVCLEAISSFSQPRRRKSNKKWHDKFSIYLKLMNLTEILDCIASTKY